jgi:hypothetical protein
MLPILVKDLPLMVVMLYRRTYHLSVLLLLAVALAVLVEVQL